MFTDMVGSTVAAQVNEREALKLRDEQEAIVRPLFSSHLGREIKSTGDGFLVVFDSALRAVECAVDVQEHLQARNSQPGSHPIRLRIGVHLGEVEERTGDVFGDSVNVASRIEPLADPGGICISEPVFGLVRNKIPNQVEKLEPRALKGVLFPVDVYRVLLARTIQEFSSTPLALSALDKSRVAVLPFVSMSPDPNDEYFSDGLTEELIGSLSLVKGLKIIARTSVMGYKREKKHISEIGRELGVGTVVEGSVRKVGNRIRVSVQVIDVATEAHLSASIYDDTLDDIFAVQSDIATKVAGSLPNNLLAAGAPIPTMKRTEDTGAYLYFLQGRALLWRPGEEPLRQSLKFFEQATERDPSFSRAWAGLAICYRNLGFRGLIHWSEAVERGRAAAERARSMSPDLAEMHSVLAELSAMADDPLEVQEKEARKALDLNPNLADAHVVLASIELLKGNLREFVSESELAYQLDPLSPRTIRIVGTAYFYAGREPDALEFWMRTLHLDPFNTYRRMTEYFISKGDLEKAGEMVNELERLSPTDLDTYLNRGYLAALKGDRAIAMEMIAKLDPPQKPGGVGSTRAGFVHLALGDVDRFFDYMWAAAKDHRLPAPQLMYSPLFAEVRKDPRLKSLLDSVGLTLPPAS